MNVWTAKEDEKNYATKSSKPIKMHLAGMGGPLGR